MFTAGGKGEGLPQDAGRDTEGQVSPEDDTRETQTRKAASLLW